MLEGVITHGTGYPNASLYGRPAAGKTGTTDGYSSAWFVGYTPQLAAVVEAGNIAAPENHPLVNVYAGGRYYAQVFGADIPALAWARTMNAALANQPYAADAATGGRLRIRGAAQKPRVRTGSQAYARLAFVTIPDTRWKTRTAPDSGCRPRTDPRPH